MRILSAYSLNEMGILSPEEHFHSGHFGRLIAEIKSAKIYDDAKTDTADGGYICPMTLDNGYEK